MHFTVEWSEAAQLWVGICSQYPSLAHMDTTPMAALMGVRELVPQMEVVEEVMAQDAGILRELARH